MHRRSHWQLALAHLLFGVLLAAGHARVYVQGLLAIHVSLHIYQIM